MQHYRQLLLASAALAATSLPAFADADVIASIKPVHSLVAAIMDGAGEPSLIVEGAGSPHTYSLKPSQAAALQDADLIFWIGEDLEAFLEKPIETIGGNAKAVELAHAHDLITLGFREGGAFEEHVHGDESEHAEHDHDHDHDHEEEHAEHDHDHDDHDHEEHAEDDHDDHDHEEHAEHDHDDHDHEDHDGHEHAEHHHGEFDMHLWLDPQNAKAMAHEIAEALAEADPDNAGLYEANAESLEERLDALTAEIDEKLAPVKDKGFIVFHDAYQYFENRFGMQAAGSITISPEVMPGADRLREVQDKVREIGAACVFAEPQFEPKLISVVTEGSEAKSGVLDPLGAGIEAGPELYFELMHNMADSFASCLTD